MFSISTDDGRAFVNKLVELQGRWAEVLASEENSSEEAADALMAAGTPLAALPRLITAQQFQGSFRSICELAAGLREEVAEQLDTLGNNGTRLFGWASGATCSDLERMKRFSEDLGLAPALLGQLVDWAMRPERMARGRLAQRVQKRVGWDRAACPVCGDAPDLAFLARENGSRSLACSGCQITWSYRRLKCVGCGTEEPETQKYLFLQEAPEGQIHYCDGCRTYLKTIDLRLTAQEPGDLLQVALLSAHLDIAAQTKGLNPFYAMQGRGN